MRFTGNKVGLGLVILITLLFSNVSFAQDSVQYTRDYSFRDGLYLTYNQFLNNKPIPKSRIVSSVDTNRIDFFRQITGKAEIVYLDDSLHQKKVRLNEVWGYAHNRSVFLYHNSDFQRLQTIGKICYFPATITVYTTVGPGMYGDRYGTPVTSMRQYIFSLKGGKVTELNINSLEYYLAADPALLAEFKDLPKRKKKDMLFVFVRKFNERNPAFFPL